MATGLTGQTPVMDVLSAIRSKRDTRAFTDQPVPDDVLGRVLDAARMAGSAKNRQPVRLVVVTDAEVIEALKGPCDFAAWIHGAPVVVVGCVERTDSIRLQFDLGRHLQNLMLAAHAEGLATCPVTVQRVADVSPILGIPDSHEALMYIPLGYKAEGGEAPPQIATPRLSMDAYVSFGSFGA